MARANDVFEFCWREDAKFEYLDELMGDVDFEWCLDYLNWAGIVAATDTEAIVEEAGVASGCCAIDIEVSRCEVPIAEADSNFMGQNLDSIGIDAASRKTDLSIDLICSQNGGVASHDIFYESRALLATSR